MLTETDNMTDLTHCEHDPSTMEFETQGRHHRPNRPLKLTTVN
jgi:hypothetical protein